MTANKKNTDTLSNKNLFWISKEKNCIAFRSVPGYKSVELSSKEEMWDLYRKMQILLLLQHLAKCIPQRESWKLFKKAGSRKLLWN